MGRPDFFIIGDLGNLFIQGFDSILRIPDSPLIFFYFITDTRKENLYIIPLIIANRLLEFSPLDQRLLNFFFKEYFLLSQLIYHPLFAIRLKDGRFGFQL